MLCDVDHFKRYNDEFGHQCGDAVLRALGEMLSKYCRRAGDIAARYGGEEFALLLPGIDSAETIGIAERLRRSVAGISIRHPKLDEPEYITISIGVTTFRSPEPCTAADVIRAADLALYRAKDAGRNRTKYEATKHAARLKGSNGQDALNFAS
jgi:diguanylate cyclase